MNETILVVDDVSTERTHLRKILEANGYKVVEAENGDKAESMALEHKVSLIMMDVVMPFNGLQAARAVKKNPLLANIPIVMVTSVSRDIDKENAKERNKVFAYLVKPATESAIMNVLNDAFGKIKSAA